LKFSTSSNAGYILADTIGNDWSWSEFGMIGGQDAASEMPTEVEPRDIQALPRIRLGGRRRADGFGFRVPDPFFAPIEDMSVPESDAPEEPAPF